MGAGVEIHWGSSMGLFKFHLEVLFLWPSSRLPLHALPRETPPSFLHPLGLGWHLNVKKEVKTKRIK